MRKKIFIGFMSLALLLMFAALVSLFELQRLTRKTQDLLQASGHNIEMSNSMLEAVRQQNNALLHGFMDDDPNYQASFDQAVAKLNQTLITATTTVRDLNELDSIYIAYDAYQKSVSAHDFAPGTKATAVWFMSSYRPAYEDLTAAIKNYSLEIQYDLVHQASKLENNVHRALMPEILTLAVMMLIIGMFYFFIDSYLSRPVVKINEALARYLKARIPFEVKADCRDEIAQLKSNIEDLISLNKQKQ